MPTRLTGAACDIGGKTTAEPAATEVATPPLLVAASPTTAPNTVAAPSPALVRALARVNGWEVGQRDRLPAGWLDAYAAAHAD